MGGDRFLRRDAGGRGRTVLDGQQHAAFYVSTPIHAEVLILLFIIAISQNRDLLPQQEAMDFAVMLLRIAFLLLSLATDALVLALGEGNHQDSNNEPLWEDLGEYNVEGGDLGLGQPCPCLSPLYLPWQLPAAKH